MNWASTRIAMPALVAILIAPAPASPPPPGFPLAVTWEGTGNVCPSDFTFALGAGERMQENVQGEPYMARTYSIYTGGGRVNVALHMRDFAPRSRREGLFLTVPEGRYYRVRTNIPSNAIAEMLFVPRKRMASVVIVEFGAAIPGFVGEVRPAQYESVLKRISYAQMRGRDCLEPFVGPIGPPSL